MTDSGRTILVVEGDAELARAMCAQLEREGFRAMHAADGTSAMEALRRRPPDLIVVDRAIPGGSSDALVEHVRRSREHAAVPIIMLSSRAGDADELAAFALGAQDFLRKPPSIKVLAARIGAILRSDSRRPERREVLVTGDVTLDRGRRSVRIAGHAVRLTSTEFRLLEALMSSRGDVLERTELVRLVAGGNASVSNRTIDVHVTALRKKLGSAAGYLRTVRGVGYAFRTGSDAWKSATGPDAPAAAADLTLDR